MLLKRVGQNKKHGGFLPRGDYLGRGVANYPENVSKKKGILTSSSDATHLQVVGERGTGSVFSIQNCMYQK